VTYATSATEVDAAFKGVLADLLNAPKIKKEDAIKHISDPCNMTIIRDIKDFMVKICGGFHYN